MPRTRKFYGKTKVQIVPEEILPKIKAICEKYGKLDEKQKAEMIQQLSEISEKSENEAQKKNCLECNFKFIYRWEEPCVSCVNYDKLKQFD